MRVSDFFDILFFTLGQLGPCFFFLLFILIYALSGWK